VRQIQIMTELNTIQPEQQHLLTFLFG
jgi:hypothetical protein